MDSILAYAQLGQNWENGDMKKNQYGLRRCDKPEEIKLPLAECKFGDDIIYHSSFAIFESNVENRRQHWHKRFPIEHIQYMNEKEQDKKLNIASGKHKSYRMPITLLIIDKIVWFVKGDRNEIKKLLWRILNIGKKGAYGYGYVSNWVIEESESDYSFYVETENEIILMRNLLQLPKTDKPISFRKGYLAIRPPYWHPYWRRECYMPC